MMVLTPNTKAKALACALVAAPTLAMAGGVPKDLPYPSGTPTANEIADQVYFVNHFYSMTNYAIKQKGREVTVLVNKTKDEKPTTITLERFLDNSPNDGVTKAQDMAFFKSGKLKGTGMLIIDFEDDNKNQSYMIWLPALRKIRRFAEPAHDDAWGGTDFTFGDVTLRKPKHETHELLGKEAFEHDCLGHTEVPKDQQSRYTKNLPGPACGYKGTEVYKLKSTTKFQNWWYDYRITYVNAKTFADIRSDYYKGDKHIKVIDRHWVDAPDLDDPRAQYWGYWYGKNTETGHETWAVIPAEATEVNGTYDANWWSEGTLRKLKR